MHSQRESSSSHLAGSNCKLTPMKSCYDNFTAQAAEQPVRVVKQITTSVSTLKDILNYCFQMNNY